MGAPRSQKLEGLRERFAALEPRNSQRWGNKGGLAMLGLDRFMHHLLSNPAGVPFSTIMSFSFVNEWRLSKDVSGWIVPKEFKASMLDNLIDTFIDGMELVMKAHNMIVISAPTLFNVPKQSLKELNFKCLYRHFGELLTTLRGGPMESKESVESCGGSGTYSGGGWTGPDGLVPFWQNRTVMEGMTLSHVWGCPPDRGCFFFDHSCPATVDEMKETGVGQGLFIMPSFELVT